MYFVRAGWANIQHVPVPDIGTHRTFQKVHSMLMFNVTNEYINQTQTQRQNALTVF